MRLSTIKLSGFKSFVDPTTLNLPSNLTGVVGPNGCGKSNIIDAVRWVMGESSASRLRGESLTDVIFAGSTARKPVNQAMVELIFDNSDHSITGQYGAFDEISVKRTVSLDGNSNYYLNGSKCRRRDITDLFLGTGLGPRSYSIIEQGMISNIILAKPEELRVYLEEAAGISKYKERRRETETRIRHTKENLERLSDLRDEVGKQLEHLKRQARQAEQYKALQEQRRVTDAQHKALEHRAVDQRLASQREKLAADETRLEQTIAQMREAEREIETHRTLRDEATADLNTRQAASYEVSGNLARIEQQIEHQRELGERLNRAHADAAAQLAELVSHVGSDQARLDALSGMIAEDEPQLESLRTADGPLQEAQKASETAVQEWQAAWDAQNKAAAEATRAADVERTAIEHLERQALDAERRQQRLQEERTQFDLEALAAALSELKEKHTAQLALSESQAGEVESRRSVVAGLQEAQRELLERLHHTRQTNQSARGRLASLETLQAAALGQDAEAAMRWIRKHGLNDAKRVGERIRVDEGFESPVELALGPLLEGVLLESPQDLLSALGELTDAGLALVDSAQHDRTVPATSLAARVQGPWAIRQVLSRVHFAETIADAQQLRTQLAADELVITRDGVRLGDGWVGVLPAGAARQGALVREREIQTLRADIEKLTVDERELEARIDEGKQNLLRAEQEREEVQRQLHAAHRLASELGGQLQSQQGRIDSATNRISNIEKELQQSQDIQRSAQDKTREARSRQEVAVQKMATLNDERQALESQRQDLLQRRDAARAAARESRDRMHALALKVEGSRAQMQGLVQTLERMSGQRGQLDSRLAELTSQLSSGDSPLAGLEAQKQAVLDQRVAAERDLAQARAKLEGLDHDLRRFEQTRQQRNDQSLQQREQIANARLQQQASVLKIEQLLEEITKAGFDFADVAAQLTDDMDATRWGQTVIELDAKLRRLEPVNLAAIQELAEAEQRKVYLDSQNDDLTAALETLEDAIRKIDRETRGRFKDTFDRVNSGLQELYPRLFGGGHAYLELTGEDLLDTGVAIMARPPGKRVSNISLLSGGEKAMTAVALVFAIFRLNPAPFCLLDEVDAPLDEANVGRLAAMVAEMSEAVQFLFVTHNKATMEAAQQLAGVTMREPGVSRLVSVDLAEATRLAGVA